MIDLGLTVYRATKGEEEAWEELVTCYQGMLQSIGRSYRLAPENISDAIQDTWLALFRDLGTLRDPERVGGWLARTMHRNCLRVRNRNAREIPRDATAMCLLADLACNDVENTLLDKERAGELADALDQLTLRQRQVVSALASDESYKDLGSTLSMPVGSIGPTRARALHQLKAILNEDETAFAEAV